MKTEEAIKMLMAMKDGIIHVFDGDRKVALDKAIEAMRNLPTQMSGTSDLISRQLAIHTITSYDGVVDKSVAKRLLIQLPSAQPERKPGKWEIYVISMFDGEGCRCSECGFEGAPYWDFCPGCGADMRGEQDDQRKSD